MICFIFIFSLTKRPFGLFFFIFLGDFLSKSKNCVALPVCEHLLTFQVKISQSFSDAMSVNENFFARAMCLLLHLFIDVLVIIFIPGVTKECFLEALKFLKTSKHPFETPGLCYSAIATLSSLIMENTVSLLQPWLKTRYLFKLDFPRTVLFVCSVFFVLFSYICFLSKTCFLGNKKLV